MNKFETTLNANWKGDAWKNEKKLSEKRIRIVSKQTENAFKIYIARLENELEKKEIEEDELFSDFNLDKSPYTVSAHEPCSIESFPETVTLMRLKVDSIRKQLEMAKKCYHEYFCAGMNGCGCSCEYSKPKEYIHKNSKKNDDNENINDVTWEEVKNNFIGKR